MVLKIKEENCLSFIHVYPPPLVNASRELLEFCVSLYVKFYFLLCGQGEKKICP